MDISRSLNDMFQALFFESIEYTPPESLIELLRQKLSVQLQDWFSFIEIKSQRNITMSLSVPIDLQALNDLVFSFSCHNEFPGLVHFVFIDRLHGRICTPALAVGSEHRLEKKVRGSLDDFANESLLSHARSSLLNSNVWPLCNEAVRPIR